MELQAHQLPSSRRSLRLLTSTALLHLGISVSALPLATVVGALSATPVLADGGQGGGPGGFGGVDSPTGTGSNGGNATGASGGGGGGAGSIGGHGGTGGDGTLGGTGGTNPGDPGQSGVDGSGGGAGGGGGGAHGFVGSTLPLLVVAGGNGGAGGADFLGGLGGGGGGGGGYGATVTGTGNLGTLTVNVAGGLGGVGGASDVGGSGGTGGIGLLLSNASGPTVTLDGGMIGGNGGAGGSGDLPGNSSGVGGIGGWGVQVNGTGANITSSVVVLGGNGGNGGAGSGALANGGDGGSGGLGVVFLSSGATFTNSGVVLGGRGGDGGDGGSIPGTIGGDGRDGGTAVAMISGGTMINSGIVSGGTGGSGGAGGGGISPGAAGLGGVGVLGRDLTVINSGLINGGVSDGGVGTRANAITFIAGTNTLELQAGSNITGNVQAFSSADTLRLGGTTNATFDVSQIGVQYLNFGHFTKTGTSTWVLTNTPVAAATSWTINQGVLQINNTGALGTGEVHLAGGTLRANVTGTIANALSLENGSTGTIVATNGNTATFSGSVFVDTNATAMKFGEAGNTGIVVLSSNGGTVVSDTFTVDVLGGTVRGTGVALGLMTGHASATNVSSGATLQYLSTASFAADVRNLQSAGTVNVGAGVTLVVGGGQSSGAITGAGGLDMRGQSYFGAGASNLFTLAGTNTYSGPTTVSGGTLAIAAGGSIVSTTTVNSGGTFVVNGTSAGVTVNAGGTLGGNGTTGSVNVNGGTLAPGNSIGTITINGSLTMSTAATYLVEVSPSGADRTNITNTASLAGTVQAQFASGSYATRSYTILSAAAGRAGTFGTLTPSNLAAGFQADLSYTSTDVLLNLTAVLGTGAPLNSNQQNVANSLNNFFNNGGALPPAFGSVFGLTGSNLANALAQLSGEIATGTQQTTFYAMDQFLGLMTDPFLGDRGAGGAGGGVMDDSAAAWSSYAAVVSKAPPAPVVRLQRWSVWTAGYGGTQQTDGDPTVGSNKLTSRVYGSAAGVDYRLSPDTMIGVALGGAGTTFAVSGLGTGSSEMFQAGVYFRHNMGAAYLAGALAYGFQDITTDRTVLLNTLRASFDANTVAGRLEAGYRVALGAGGLTPYAAGQFTTFFLPDYAEQVVAGNNDFALAYREKDATASRSELGLRADTSFMLSDGLVTLRGRGAWAHNFNTDRTVSTFFQTLPTAGFGVAGAEIARDSALVSAAAEIRWRSGLSVAATFEGEFSNVTESYGGKGVVRYQW